MHRHDDQLYGLLSMCDEEFVPPLSTRNSTTQTDLRTSTGETANGDVSAYYDSIAKQEQLRMYSADKLVGFASYVHREDDDGTSVAYLSTILTHPEHRGEGLSRKMYAALFAMLDEDVLELRTWSTNGAHLHVLDKMGFVESKRIVDDRGEGIDTIYFRKRLRGE